MIVIPNGSHKSFRKLPSWHNLLPQGLSIISMVGKGIFCTRHPLLGQIMPPKPSASLRPPYYQVMCCLLNTKLLVWSSCLVSLFLAHPYHLFGVKAEWKKVYYWGWACVLLMRPLARRLACLFSSLGIWTNLVWCLPTLFLTCSRYFFIHSPLHSYSPFTWLVTTESRNKQPYLWPLLLW